MSVEPPAGPGSATLGEPQACGKCQTVSRLTNGLCLNCLLLGALEPDETPSDKEAFREVLASVKASGGDCRIADHEILGEIARGGMGVVYRAKEPHSGRVVALKCVLVRADDSDQALARFRREAETAARLEHPNIVPIYQVGETAEGIPYYTMKLAAAGSLAGARDRLLAHPRQSIGLILKVARAVHYAHEQGVLHRDLKPGNILLDGRGEPLVSDFGLARCELVSGYLTRSLASFGTPGYMAPEQADGPAANLTRAADVYSLGAILFELLAGRTPFVAESAFAVMKQAANEAAPKLRQLVPHIDRDLQVICARCLEREPGDRYQSAAQLADDLQAWLEDRPIAASSPGPVLRTRRWVRRNPLLAATVGALAVLLACAFVWQLRMQRRELTMTESVLTARSVVVLPFLDLDTVEGDPEVTQWVADSLRSQLNSLGPARVVVGNVPSWNRLDQVRRAAQANKGRTILTGTVRNVDGQRRVSLRLLSLAADQALLRATITRTDPASGSSRDPQKWVVDIHNLLNTESWANLAPTDPGVRNEKAMEAMTAGRNLIHSYTISDNDRAIALFREATELEPESALAHSYLASAAVARNHYIADFSFLELGKAEALKALALDRDSVAAHRALAGVYFQEGKFHEALEEQMRTMEIGGADSAIAGFAGQTLNVLGRPDRAICWCAIAARLHDTPGAIEPTIGDCWVQLGDDKHAFAAYDRATELKPGSNQGALSKAHLHMLRGEFDAARELCRDHLRQYEPELTQVAAQIEFFDRNWSAAEELYSRLAKTDPDGGGSFYGAVSFQSALGRIQQATGLNESARTLLEAALTKETATLVRQPSNPEVAYRLAAIEASLNSIEPALQHLRQAIVEGWLDYRSLQKDPRFDSIRNHPEFGALIDGLSARVVELRHNVENKEKK